MSILLGCGKGLLQLGDSRRMLPCPLRRVTHLAQDGQRMAAADDASHQLWLNGSVRPIASGLEALALWGDRCLLLSGDTDCLTLLDAASGELVFTATVGVYPQDFCLLPRQGLIAVAGGSDGTLRLLSADDLRTLHTAFLPGAVQRVTASDGWLYALCLAEDDGLQCLLMRLPLRGDRPVLMARLAGLPGALHADGTGGVWAAASETLYHFPAGRRTPDKSIPGMGLIRHMDAADGALLLTDPVMEACCVLLPDGSLRTLYQGEVGQALYVSS